MVLQQRNKKDARGSPLYTACAGHEYNSEDSHDFADFESIRTRIKLSTSDWAEIQLLDSEETSTSNFTVVPNTDSP